MSVTAPEDKVSLLDVVVKVAVLTEKIESMEKKSGNTTGNLALIVSVLVLLLNFGSKISWV